MNSTALASLDVAPRIARLRSRIDAEQLDALLVTKLANVRYLTGFTGSAALLLVTADDALFVTDGRYTEQFNFVRCMSIAGGSDEINKNVIGERALGLPREPDPNKGAPHTYGGSAQSASQGLTWFNTACFAAVPQGVVRPGNAGRYTVRGPGFQFGHFHHEEFQHQQGRSVEVAASRRNLQHAELGESERVCLG